MVYEMTRSFPPEEKFGLISQLNRAVVSVASNLAEGSSRTSYKDQAHLTQMAFSSLMEVACQMTLAEDLGMVMAESHEQVRGQIEELSRRLNALR
jgi:four helix bundle protein